MTTDANKAKIRRFLEEGINQKNLAVLPEIFDADLAWHGGAFGEVRGLETFLQVVGPFFMAFPDLTVTVRDLFAEGDKVMAHFGWEGTHQGDFLGVPATGRRGSATGFGVYRFAGGKVVEEWWAEDLLGVLQQVGGLPAPAAATA